jgi:hypothetical protein
VTVQITGPSGIGKSEMVAQVRDAMARELKHEVGLGRHYTPTWSLGDVAGFLVTEKRMMKQADGMMKEVTVAVWSVPTWMLDDKGVPLNDYPRGILVLEEHDKAIPEVKKGCGPILLSKGMGTNRLHDGIGVVVLTNDASSSRQGSTKSFDFEINRQIILSASTTLDGWMNWADQNDVHYIFKSFAEDKPEIVFSGTVPEKQGPFCTPRSLVMLQKVARYMIDEDGRITDNEGLTEIAMGGIGAPATQALMSHIALHDKVPKWAEIVKDPKRTKVPDEATGQMMVAHQCAYNVDDKTIEQAVTYVRRLRPEFYMVFVKSATKRNFRLVNAKAMKEWTRDEPQLVALINALGGR